MNVRALTRGPLRLSRRLTICNEKGLHARASAKLAALSENFEAEGWVARDGEQVGADSIMGLLTLMASCGSEIEISAMGPDAAEMLEAMESLIASRFGEER